MMARALLKLAAINALTRAIDRPLVDVDSRTSFTAKLAGEDVV